MMEQKHYIKCSDCKYRKGYHCDLYNFAYTSKNGSEQGVENTNCNTARQHRVKISLANDFILLENLKTEIVVHGCTPAAVRFEPLVKTDEKHTTEHSVGLYQLRDCKLIHFKPTTCFNIKEVFTVKAMVYSGLGSNVDDIDTFIGSNNKCTVTIDGVLVIVNLTSKQTVEFEIGSYVVIADNNLSNVCYQSKNNFINAFKNIGWQMETE